MRETKPAAFCEDLARHMTPRWRPTRSLAIVAVALTITLCLGVHTYLTMPITAVDHLTLVAMLTDAGEGAPALRQQLLARFDVPSLAEIRQYQASEARQFIASHLTLFRRGLAARAYLIPSDAGVGLAK